jgi:hypothetical protein
MKRARVRSRVIVGVIPLEALNGLARGATARRQQLLKAWTLGLEALHMTQQQNNQQRKAEACSALANT